MKQVAIAGAVFLLSYGFARLSILLIYRLARRSVKKRALARMKKIDRVLRKTIYTSGLLKEGNDYFLYRRLLGRWSYLCIDRIHPDGWIDRIDGWKDEKQVRAAFNYIRNNGEMPPPFGDFDGKTAYRSRTGLAKNGAGRPIRLARR